ncbi:hypothetical protein G983_02231 [Escherichia coli UMEA 3656-1]|nr:hypothetical protein G983_02231 [Escherichia coli UMEA 3656-1]
MHNSMVMSGESDRQPGSIRGRIEPEAGAVVDGFFHFWHWQKMLSDTHRIY